MLMLNASRLLTITVTGVPVVKQMSGGGMAWYDARKKGARAIPAKLGAWRKYIELCAKEAAAAGKWEKPPRGVPVYIKAVAYVRPTASAGMDRWERSRGRAQELARAIPLREPSLCKFADKLASVLCGICYDSALQVAGVSLIKRYVNWRDPDERVEITVGVPKDRTELEHDVRHV